MTEEAKIPDDLDHREQALNPHCSYICEAPAGSGKTELLTQRVLVLLSVVKRPEEILAITFTRKAAGEMRDRIIRALKRATLPAPASAHELKTWTLAKSVLERDIEMGWELMENPNRLKILTFDSLCSQLTKSLPLHSGLGADMAISEDSSRLYREAAKQLYASLEDDSPWKNALVKLLLHLDHSYSRFESLCMQMLQTRDAWMPMLGKGSLNYPAGLDVSKVRSQLELHLRHVLNDAVAELKQLIPHDVWSPLSELADFAASHLIRENISSPITACHQMHLSIAGLPDVDSAGILWWQGLQSLLLTQTGGWRKSLDKRSGFPAGTLKEEKAIFKEKKQQALALIAQLSEVPGLLEALQDISAWPPLAYDDSQWDMLHALTDLLPVLVAYLQLAFSDAGGVDFSEMSMRALSALGGDDNPTDLALRLDHRIQHVLVDEFQDTSGNQLQLLKKLTEGWQDGDGRTLFCVGDAMQSIYGFRGANVGLFLYCKTHGLGNIPLVSLKLTTNFRSQATLVQWFNQVFQDAMPEKDDISRGAVQFSPSSPFLPSLQEGGVSVLGFNQGEPDEEAQAIVDRVLLEKSHDPDCRIAILLRSKHHVLHVLPFLRRENILYRAVDLEALSTQGITEDLMALTDALLQPANRIAWLAVLRAPWCGLSLHDLVALNDIVGASDSNTGSASDSIILQKLRWVVEGQSGQLSEEGGARLLRISHVFESVFAQRYRKPLRQWVEGCWYALGGPSCLSSETDLVNAKRFFALLESYDIADVIADPVLLHDAVSRLFASPDPQADDRVQIMTMHKSKGLEFDVVILPGLHRGSRGIDQPLLQWRERVSSEGQEELIMSAIPQKGGESDRVYQYLQHEQKKVEAYEAARLLYVACTRAQKSLIMMVGLQRDGVSPDAPFKPLAKKSLGGYVWSYLKPEIQWVGEDKNISAIHLENTHTSESDRPLLDKVKNLARLPSDWRLPGLPEEHVLDPYIPHFEYSDNSVELVSPTAEDIVPRAMGTLLHQVLHAIGEEGLLHWQDKALADYLPFWRARLIHLGVPLNHLDASLKHCLSAIEHCLMDSHLQWLFSSEHKCEQEFSITVTENGEPIHYVLDVVLTDSEGQVWVVDFKTSCPAGDETVEEFLESEQRQYQEVMMQYAKAISKLKGQKVKRALYFPLIQQWYVYP